MERYDDVATILTGEWDATAEDAVTWVQELCAALKMPGLSTYGVKAADFATIIEKSTKSSSMKGNPIKLTAAELRGILMRAL